MTLALQRLLVATTNAGKLRDFAVAAGGHLEIVPLPGLNAIAAPAEDEPTFEGNARVKAIYYSRFAPGEIVLADDSGLEVDALNGAPGIRSARYAEDLGFVSDEPIDTRNNLCLMAALRETPANARQARYRCVLAGARDGEVIAIGSGSVEGTILAAAQGTGGFGYDPFFLPIGEIQSMAELDSARRMTLSHRGRALKALVSGLMDRDDTSTT